MNEIQEATFGKYYSFLLFNIQFTFSLLSSAFKTGVKFFEDPLKWIQEIAIGFPSGASFFISYVFNVN